MIANLNLAGKQRRIQKAETRRDSVLFRPLFIGDWEHVSFLHYEIPPARLQPHVPFALDTFEGSAWVSVVAFTMRNMHPPLGGALARWLFAPVREQRFLNLRTYVRAGNETGIHFVREWISSRLCARLGPPMYGLPYRRGRHHFWYSRNGTECRGRVEPIAAGRPARGEREIAPAFAFELSSRNRSGFGSCACGSIDEWLLERYVAFTAKGAKKRFFRIRHELWQQRAMVATRLDESLLASSVPWWPEARFVAANHSLGVSGVWMGPPLRGTLS